MDGPMSKVALIRCESYDIEEVRRAVKRGLDLLGGTSKFARKGQKVLLKPNLLVGDLPEKCVNTHSAVFRAVAEQFMGVGASLSWGDSPGFGSPAAAAKKPGILGVAEKLGIPEADFKTGIEVFYDKGEQNKKFTIASGVKENDIIVSLPKLKTHGLEKITGAVKNQFGCVPGVRKGEYHIKLQDPDSFARMLVDLNNLVNPALYIMDGVWAMEGNGPRGGTPRKMNLLLFSTDPIALDATVCRLIDLNPEYVPTIKFGQLSGSGTYHKDEIELLGDDLDGFKQPDFDINRGPLKAFQSKGVMRFMNNRLVPRPYIIEEKCISCGMCISICPTNQKSVDWTENDKTKPPDHNYKTCIRCYCCQEICPEGAIELKVPFIRKFFRGK